MIDGTHACDPSKGCGVQEGRTRVVLNCTPPYKSRLRRLRDRLGASSYSEVLRRCVSTFELLVELSDSGRELEYRRMDGSTGTIVIPTR